jgi:hypothetical protein
MSLTAEPRNRLTLRALCRSRGADTGRARTGRRAVSRCQTSGQRRRMHASCTLQPTPKPCPGLLLTPVPDHPAAPHTCSQALAENPPGVCRHAGAAIEGLHSQQVWSGQASGTGQTVGAGQVGDVVRLGLRFFLAAVGLVPRVTSVAAPAKSPASAWRRPGRIMRASSLACLPAARLCWSSGAVPPTAPASSGRECSSAWDCWPLPHPRRNARDGGISTVGTGQRGRSRPRTIVSI